MHASRDKYDVLYNILFLSFTRYISMILNNFVLSSLPFPVSFYRFHLLSTPLTRRLQPLSVRACIFEPVCNLNNTHQ